MPSLTLPPVPRYVLSPTVNEELEYADLPIIDLSKGNTPEGRDALASQVCEAMTTQGFFYVINHGYTSAQVSRY
ncbi:hypothetical protein VKT23_008997 [Stygiomarasmius scandens]|uniref:Non-haem dioxygenase N-terminal domain-containing protein n=1 Tax=Marasmiellus scandens TaxID=2682957 RepID=A0ABR1JKD1_9AGAR